MNKKDLLKALKKVKPGLGNEDDIEQATAFAFLNNHIITYNDEISIRHPVKDLDIEGAVQAEELYKLLKKLPEDEIELEHDGNEVTVKSGNATAGFTLQSEIKLPLEEIGDKKTRWREVPDNFQEALKYTTPFCAKAQDHPILNCVNFRKDGVVEACDNYRITYYQIDSSFPSFLLPADTAEILMDYDIKEITGGEMGWIHFKTESDTIISCRIYEESFPDTSELIDVDGTEIIFPEGLSNALDRALVFAERESVLDEKVIIYIENDVLTIKSESETGWFTENIDYVIEKEDYEEPIEFIMNPEFLQSIIGKGFEATMNEDKIKFVGEDWIHVIALHG